MASSARGDRQAAGSSPDSAASLPFAPPIRNGLRAFGMIYAVQSVSGQPAFETAVALSS